MRADRKPTHEGDDRVAAAPDAEPPTDVTRPARRPLAVERELAHPGG